MDPDQYLWARFHAQQRRSLRNRMIARTMRIILWIALGAVLLVVGYAVSMIPAKTNSATLCSDSQTSCGTFDTIPASTAPAPSVTNSAGKAQQNMVLNDVSKVIVLMVLENFIVFHIIFDDEWS